MNKEDFKDLVTKVYDNACNKGFHDNERDIRVAMQLVSDEVAELHDALRNGKLFEQCDKPITNFTCFEEETADIVIRIMDNIGGYKTDVDVVFWYMEEDRTFDNSILISINCYTLNSILFSEILLNNPASSFGDIIGLVERISIKHGYSIWDSIERKMAYNTTRPYLNGKKF